MHRHHLLLGVQVERGDVEFHVRVDDGARIDDCGWGVDRRGSLEMRPRGRLQFPGRFVQRGGVQLHDRGSLEVRPRGRLQPPGRVVVQRGGVHLHGGGFVERGGERVGPREVELCARLNLRHRRGLGWRHVAKRLGRRLAPEEQIPRARLHLGNSRLLLRGEARDVKGLLLLGRERPALGGIPGRRRSRGGPPRVRILAPADALDASPSRAPPRRRLNLQDHPPLRLVEPGEVRERRRRVRRGDAGSARRGGVGVGRGPLRRRPSPGDSAALNRLDPRRRRVHLRRVALARREVRSLERGVARGGVLRREDTQDGGARRARGSFDRRRPLDAPRFDRQRLPRLRLPEPKLGDELASPFPARERLVLLGSPPEQGLESHHRAVRLRGVLRLHRRRHRRRLWSLGAPLRGDGFGRGRDGGAAGRDRAGRRGLRRDRAGRVIPRVVPRRRRLSFLPLHLLVHRVQHSLRSLLLHTAPRGLLPDPHLGRSRLEHARHRRLRVPLVRLGRDGLVKRLRVVQGAVRDAVEEVPGGVNLRVGDQAAHRVGDVLFGGVIGVLVHDGALVLVPILERRGAILTQLSQRLEPLRLDRRKLFVLLR